MTKKCDIIIPVWNELESTKECINKLKENTNYPYRLIIIDNGSEKLTKEYLENLKEVFPGLILIRNNVNLGFIKAINQGIVASDNPYILIFNNDAYVTENWLTNMVETVESGPENIGIANPTSNTFGKNQADGRRGEWQELDSARGFCMLIKREVVEKIGLFDEVYGIGYFEEKDFSRRAIEAGYICIRAKSSFVFHKDKLSFNRIRERDEIFNHNEEIYNRKWGRPLSIAFIIKKEEELINQTEIIYTLLSKGHRINIFYMRKRIKPRLKDHIQIRYFPINALFFQYATLFKIMRRYKKKRVELITSRDNLLYFFDKLKFVHKAKVVNYDRSSIYAICNALSRST